MVARWSAQLAVAILFTCGFSFLAYDAELYKNDRSVDRSCLERWQSVDSFCWLLGLLSKFTAMKQGSDFSELARMLTSQLWIVLVLHPLLSKHSVHKDNVSPVAVSGFFLLIEASSRKKVRWLSHFFI